MNAANRVSPLDFLRLHGLVVILSLLAEWIGIIKIPAGVGTLLLLPLFYTFSLAIVLNPHLTTRFHTLVPPRLSAVAAPITLIAIMPFIARFGSTIGPATDQIISAGPALILQELGNLGTMLIALPFAVLVLKMGREAIGATYSIAREPNIAIISDRYGLKGPEGIGVMGVYVVGTMFGTLWFALMAGFLASMDLFDPRALAMACGVGSASMVAACSGALTEAVPALREELLAFSGASNLLTYATGLYVSLFIALPVAEWLYRRLKRHTSQDSTEQDSGAEQENDAVRPEQQLGRTALTLAAVCVVGWLSNTVSSGQLWGALPGMVMLYLMTLAGLAVTRVMPFYLPAVAWVSLISILVTLPFFPGSAWLVEQLSAVNFLAIVTPALGYAGLALSRHEFVMFRRTGWKLVIISLLVFTGTYLGSALVAQVLL
ncbi:DUF3100 domain-containing protein [Kushneria phyllosphaerae]|uniref:DUF3100 domain-containing protein n=1 Tax=Kushneria phyllosphaerae TaxID=2100822 RepID=A0A2R8CGV2_9GAMM|nr:DUF3100 domain-containing protein [Kushneria phyllosphaerae]SPJ32125.1 hypothetical protein KSP9073_00125 [Kushneria phyllosphaerae]